MRIEHWDVAFNHGKTAALNMLGRDVAHTEVPYFYSVLADWGELEYVGPAYGWDQEIVRGSLDDGKFTDWYLQDGVVKAALTFGRSDDLDAARRLIVDGRALDESERAKLGDVDSDLGRHLGLRAAFSRAAWLERESRRLPTTPLAAATAAPKPVGTRVSSCELITRSMSPYSRACSAVK